MASTTPRRPLPALVALVALLILTGLVWWRVLNRGHDKPRAQSCPVSKVKVHLPAPANVTVSVLNATKHSGIAAQARSALVADGFNSPGIAANDRKYQNKIKGVAEIRFGPAAKQGATLLRYYFPGAALLSLNTKSTTVIVSLGNQYKAVATAKAVQAQLARDKAVSGTATPSPGSTCKP